MTGATAHTTAIGTRRSGLGERRRRLWLTGTVLATAVPIVVVAASAPSAGARPDAALTWALFIGSSVHVASTGWFYSVPEVRRHMRARPARYVHVPVALVVVTSALATQLTPARTTWLLLAVFAWQFHHFQKQNLGVAVLAARSLRIRPPTRTERRALAGAGAGGVLALIGHPALLQLAGAHRMDPVFDAGATLFTVSAVAGAVALVRRPAADRPAAFVAVHLGSLLFFLPAVTLGSPYTAVAGLTIAHGLQYLLLVGLVAATPTDGRRARTGMLVLVDIAVVGGLALNRMSHLHGGDLLGRALFGAYLGLTMAHVVVDAGLWRLRDRFPREFLGRRLPYLLLATPVSDDRVRTASPPAARA